MVYLDSVLFKKTYIVISLILLSSSFIQNNEPKRLVIKAKFDFFTVDNIGNIYTIKEDELVKYLPNGKFFARYSNLKLGSISKVDATNPLKLVVYYRDFQQIVFLDNQLSVNSEIVSLEKLGYEQTDLVCASNNNSFWIYSKQNNELHRFNENSKEISATGNLKQILQNELSPNFMLEHNGYLYLNSPETGIYVFDIFGTFSRIIAIKHLRQFQVNENIVYYQRDSIFCSYNYTLFEEACKTIPYWSKVQTLKYRNTKLYSGFKDSITVHDF
jgi:hypothetical protein